MCVQAAAPDPALIPAGELLGVTVIILSCFYRESEFVRVGYYVANEYDTEELRDEPPETVLLSRVVRSILADKPRVTRYPISWGEALPSALEPPALGPSALEPPTSGSKVGSPQSVDPMAVDAVDTEGRAGSMAVAVGEGGAGRP